MSEVSEEKNANTSKRSVKRKKLRQDEEEVIITGFQYSRRRVRAGFVILFVGYLIFLLGAKPSLFGMDRSPVIGFVQTATFLVGLGIMCLGGYIVLISMWSKEYISLTADLGVRVITTGYVIAVFCGMADVFGIGSHPTSMGVVPFFGPLQSRGVLLGEGIIATGMIMMISPKQAGTRHIVEDNSKKIDMTEG